MNVHIARAGRACGGAWWLRLDPPIAHFASTFIDLDPTIRVPSFCHLDVHLDLEPGAYVIGCGRGPDAYRDSFVVGEKLGSRPCAVPGCGESMAVKPAEQITPWDPSDGAPPPADRCCEAHR